MLKKKIIFLEQSFYIEELIMKLLSLFFMGLILFHSTVYAQDNFNERVIEMKHNLEEKNLTTEQLKEWREKLIKGETKLKVILEEKKLSDTKSFLRIAKDCAMLPTDIFFAVVFGVCSAKTKGVSRFIGAFTSTVFAFDAFSRITETYYEWQLSASDSDQKLEVMMSQLMSDFKVNITAIDLILAEQ